MMDFPETARRHIFDQLYNGARLGNLAMLEGLRELPVEVIRELVEVEKESDNEEGSTALIVACRGGEDTRRA